MSRETRDSAGFSAREYQLLAGAMKSLKNEIQVDYNKFAQQCGFKNANSAKASWCGLRRKIEKMEGGLAGDAATSSSPEEAEGDGGKASKRRKSDAAEGDDEEQSSALPAKKKGKKASAKATPGKTKEEKDVSMPSPSDDDPKPLKQEANGEED